MKSPTFIYFAAGLTALISLEIIAALVVGFHHAAPPVPAQRSGPHQSPPPGYAIETNGKEWRWARKESNSTWTQWMPFDTKDEAIRNAWTYYNFSEDQQAHPWRLETPAPDPNTGLTLMVPYHEPMPMIDNNAAEYGDGSGTVTHTNEPQPSTELKRAPIIRTGPAKGTP